MSQLIEGDFTSLTKTQLDYLGTLKKRYDVDILLNENFENYIEAVFDEYIKINKLKAFLYLKVSDKRLYALQHLEVLHLLPLHPLQDAISLRLPGTWRE